MRVVGVEAGKVEIPIWKEGLNVRVVSHSGSFQKVWEG